jgi:hypothetical protein
MNATATVWLGACEGQDENIFRSVATADHFFPRFSHNSVPVLDSVRNDENIAICMSGDAQT